MLIFDSVYILHKTFHLSLLVRQIPGVMASLLHHYSKDLKEKLSV